MFRPGNRSVALPVSVASWAAIFLARLPAARALASCPPPRFDTFADENLGKWQFGPNIPDQAREVEEVMRSCGGAVQGIREIVLPTVAISAEINTSTNEVGDQQGRYHNRADDGFVYFDSGSYSAGPVQIADGDDVEFMASLSFGSTLPKRRLLVSTSCRAAFAADCPIVQIISNGGSNFGTMVGLSRVPFRQPEDTDMTELPSVQDLHSFTEPAHEISWHKETICKMASPSQPWMLQRAKWESFANEDFNKGDDGAPSGEEKPARSDLIGWVRMLGGEEIGCVSSNAVASEGLAMQIGTLCAKTKEASAVVRCYDTKGKLQGVILQEGMLIDS